MVNVRAEREVFAVSDAIRVGARCQVSVTVLTRMLSGCILRFVQAVFLSRPGSHPGPSFFSPRQQKPKLLTTKQVKQRDLPTIAQKYEIKAIREWVGISQSELARLSGITRAAMANVESNRYWMSARDGARLFEALTNAIPPESHGEREITRHEALRLLKFQRELNRKEANCDRSPVPSTRKAERGITRK